MSVPELVEVGVSKMPKWLWDQLQGYPERIRREYFHARGLEVYYDGPGADATYLEERVGTLAWSRALAAWECARHERGTIHDGVAGGPVSSGLADVLGAEVHLDLWAVVFDQEAPGPAVSRVAIWDVDWWQEGLGLRPVTRQWCWSEKRLGGRRMGGRIRPGYSCRMGRCRHR